MKNIYSTFFALGCVLIFFGIISAEAQQFTKDRPLAIVRRFKPEVQIQNEEEARNIFLNPAENVGEQLFSGDTLSTKDEGFALVYFMDKSIAKVKPQSFLILHGEVSNNVKDMSTRINLEQGEVYLNVEPQGTSSFEVATSRSLASVKGTDFGSKSSGYFWVDEGQVDITALNSGQTVSLFEKMFAQVDDQGNNIETGVLSDEELDELNTGYDELEEEMIRKEIKLRFRDQNGQIREVTIEAFEKNQN